MSHEFVMLQRQMTTLRNVLQHKAHVTPACHVTCHKAHVT